MNNYYKKSVNNSNKTSISFLESVSSFSDYLEYKVRGIYPLILRLNKNEMTEIFDKYYEDLILEESKKVDINFMKINIKMINSNFINDKIFLDKYYRHDGKILFIHGLFYDHIEDLHSSICFVSKRSLFVKGESRKDSEEIYNLEINAFNDYLNNPNREKVKIIK